MRSISFRLTIWYALAATVTAAVFLLVGRYVLEDSYISGIDDLNDKEFEEIGPRIKATNPGDVEAAGQAILGHTEIDASLYFFQLERQDGSVFFTSSNLSGHRMPIPSSPSKEFTVVDDELGRLRVGMYRVLGYNVFIATSLQGWESLNARLLRLSGLILGLVFLASLAVGYFLSRVALNPIASIERTANRIGVDNLGERIEIPNTRDEIARLTIFLNEMFDRLELAVMQAQKFAADASHELKTPLSLLRLRIESLLRDGSALTEQGNVELEEQLGDIERLTKVVDDMLLLAKSEAGVLKLNIVEVSLEKFLEDFAEDARVLCEENGVRFELVEEARGLAPFDEMWIRHALFNLLSNALKFSERGSRIQLVSCFEDGCWVMSFEDEGPGVADSKLQSIFDRFYSEDAGGKGSGSGLGLAFCRSIVMQHRGRIAAENCEDGKGLRILIKIPLSH